MTDEVSKSGVFIDNSTGKVTTSQPEEGVQLVSPGGVIDDQAARAIEVAKAASTDDPKPVTSGPTTTDSRSKSIR